MIQAQADIPPHRYTAELAAEIEARWQDYWEEHGTFAAPNPVGPLADPTHPRADAEKLYVIDMFPYPSGAGLHVGHPLGYIGTDSYTRYFRMIGRNVLHPMGFDAFGLPAEQYAVQTGTHPRKTTEENVDRYRAQLRRLGLAYDNRRSFATTDVGYYRWTQWIFLQIFNSWYDPQARRARPVTELADEFAAGRREVPGGRDWAALTPVEQRKIIDGYRLAYISEAPVNWCPGLGTVLANEEVTADGRSERGNFPVFKRSLKQWMMRITAYGDRLLEDLDGLDWPEPIKLMQRNWIGRSTGAHIDFGTDAGPIRVFTTRPDTVFGATYMVLAPEHELVDLLVAGAWPEGTKPAWTGGHASPAGAVAAYRASVAGETEAERTAESREKTGVFVGAYAVNPVNGARIPVFIADYVLAGYGTGAIMAVPGQDERDWEFAEKFDLPIIRTVQPPADFDGKAFVGEGPAINSSAPQALSLDGMGIADAKKAITSWLEEHGYGTGAVTYRLRDWLFSRQRYWGEPFPIVYDGTGMPVPVPESMLPVELPEIDDFSPKTFDPDDAGSTPETPLSRARDWVEVELDLGDGPRRYVRETNTMPQWAGSCWYELRYLDPTNDKALVDPENERYWMGPREPGDCGGVDLYVGGVEHAVLHLLYARFWHKVLYDMGVVSTTEPFHRLVHQGTILGEDNQKMSKSVGNVVNPDEMIDRFGADATRIYEMFLGPLEASKPWSTRGVEGITRFLDRVWRLFVTEEGAIALEASPPAPELRRELHQAIRKVTEDLEALKFNTAIARLMVFVKEVTKGAARPREVLEPFVLLLNPFAPHLAEELWHRLGHAESCAYEPWPVHDPALVVEETVTVAVQVNGKLRATLDLPRGLDQQAAQRAALDDARVRRHVDGAELRKVIYVPDKLLNLVVASR